MTMGPEPMSRILWRSVRRGMCRSFLVVVRARSSVAPHIMGDTPLRQGAAGRQRVTRRGHRPEPATPVLLGFLPFLDRLEVLFFYLFLEVAHLSRQQGNGLRQLFHLLFKCPAGHLRCLPVAVGPQHRFELLAETDLQEISPQETKTTAK